MAAARGGCDCSGGVGAVTTVSIEGAKGRRYVGCATPSARGRLGVCSQCGTNQSEATGFGSLNGGGSRGGTSVIRKPLQNYCG